MAIHLIHPPQSFDSQFCKEDKRRMTLDDIYYNISEATFSALVCQADIRTKAELKSSEEGVYGQSYSRSVHPNLSSASDR